MSGGSGSGGAGAGGADAGGVGGEVCEVGEPGAHGGRLFGTDGIRARFGEPPLDQVTVTALGRELAAMLRERAGAAGGGVISGHGPGPGARPERGPATAAAPVVILGGDTRESTSTLCGWLAEGLGAGGAVVRCAGVIPTPGVSFLAAQLGAAAGVVVSASHNPFPDNGIKLLGGDGCKWSDADEVEIEGCLRAGGVNGPRAPGATAGAGVAAAHSPVAPGPGRGQPLTVETELREMYLRHLAGSLAAGAAAAGAGDRGQRAPSPGRPLAGLRIVLDAGNGAASCYAGELFTSLGAEVTLLGASPDGRNVNLDCGSTAPGKMAAAVVTAGAHLGAAFDGDADRCILADERGEVRDGDAILYQWAKSLIAAGKLIPPAIVATSMSNLGLERALAREGIAVVRCDVGDRAVVEEMSRRGIRLGGEQSGHIVCRDLAATGDGLLTAVQMAAIVRHAGRPLSEMLAGFRRYPQILLSVRVARKPDLATLPRVAATARAVADELGADGRLVLRYSGTEPLARVMIEGPDQSTINSLAGRLADVLTEEIGVT